MTPEERLAARKLNEQTELSATALNALAVALTGAAIIIPGVRDLSSLLSWQPLLLLFVALTVPIGARRFLLLLRSEE